MKRIYTVGILSIMLTILSISILNAQQPVPIGPGDGDGVTTPIGGLAILAALGGGYAVKKLRGNSRES